ncbi:hypothetical protein I260019D6_14830 [Dorea longicatena]|uniref:hypothetical protein n=1 Tax=Dorea longicatena TaxID=88431 RepID=UPI0036F2759A
MNQRKLLKELNLLDKFLFDEAMDDPENVKTMLDIILLNTRGKHPELVSPELIELLKYIERSTDEVSGECKSKRIQEMHRRVCQIKASEKTEVKYMQSWEERIMIKQEGIAEGRIEGEKALLKSLIEKKMAKKIFCRANFGNVRGRCFRSREYYERNTERKVSVRNC